MSESIIRGLVLTWLELCWEWEFVVDVWY